MTKQMILSTTQAPAFVRARCKVHLQNGGMRPTFEQRFWVELRVVRIIWRRLLAVVAILNDSNIYFCSKIVSLGMMILGICHV